MWNFIYFGLMDYTKQFLYQPKTKQEKLLQSFITGYIGATVATFFNAPFDVVKSRIQSQLYLPDKLPGSPSTPVKYRSTFQTLYLIYKEEGLASCYKGFQPKVIRMGLGGAVAISSFEFFANIGQE